MQHTLANAAQRTFALLAVATIAAAPAVAANRAPRLHPGAHPAGHFVATQSYSVHEHRHRAASHESVEVRHPKHGKKATEGRTALPASKAHGKDSRRKHHEPEVVDDPVIMHRASAHGHKLTRREKQEDLAEARVEASYEAAHHARTTKHYEPARVVAARQRGYEQPAPRYTPPETDPAASQYSSREFTASYNNVARGVGDAVRRNAYTRNAPDTAIGTALRSNPGSTDAALPQYAAPTTDSVADQARRSSVVVRHPVPPSLLANDAQLRSQRYQPRVVAGFGAEVAPLPSTNSRGDANSSALATEAQDLGEDLAVNGVASAHVLANDAMQPLVTPMYTREGSLLMPAPLRGSHEILVHQNIMADHDGLERIRDDNQLNRLRADHQLVSFPESASLRINEGLPENRRVARPWTVQFAADAARAFYQHFGEPLQVNSAVRTVSYQARLQRVNGNAAATRGEGASPHLTGQAMDLAKRGMSAEEIAWMRTYLLPFIDAGKVDVEEEFQQACFHISVYRSYLPLTRRPAMQVAQVHALPATPVTRLPINADNDR